MQLNADVREHFERGRRLECFRNRHAHCAQRCEVERLSRFRFDQRAQFFGRRVGEERVPLSRDQLSCSRELLCQIDTKQMTAKESSSVELGSATGIQRRLAIARGRLAA